MPTTGCFSIALAITFVTGFAARADTLEGMISSDALSGTYNPALIDFLLEEGKDKIPAGLHKRALDQAVASLRAKANVSDSEQLSAALSSAIGMAMQMSSDDVVSGAGADVEGSTYTGEWGSWVDAAEKLQTAGYQDDAVAFFEYGMNTIPYAALRNRCVLGLVRADAEGAFDKLIGLTEQPNMDLKNAALRSLGLMVASGGLSEAQATKAMDTLTAHAEGIMNAGFHEAAILGLGYANDDRAIAPLSNFKSGLSVTDEKQRPALRALLLTYNDDSSVAVLKKMIKGGMMSTYDAWDRLFAGRLLMQAGKQEGFDWALKELKPKKKSMFSSSKDEPDIRASIVVALTRVGGDDAKRVLNQAFAGQKKDALMKATIAIALLQLGDDGHIDTVKSAMQHEGWDFTAANAAMALAGHGDYSGIPVLDRLATQEPKRAGAGMSALKMLAGKSTGNQSEKDRIIRLRQRIAWCLGNINKTESVPTLTQLLKDDNPDVRSSAAYALAELKLTSALQALSLAMGVDYGKNARGESRNPTIKGYLMRTAMAKYPGKPGLTALLSQAAMGGDPTLKFMALAGQN